MSATGDLPPLSIRVAVLVVLLAVLCGFGAFFIAGSEVPKFRILADEGVVADAEIVDRGSSTTGGPTTSGGREFWIEVAFTPADGSAHNAAFGVTRQMYESLQGAARVRVIYLPDDPDVAIIEGEEPDASFGYWLGWAWIVGVLVAGVPLGIRELKRL